MIQKLLPLITLLTKISAIYLNKQHLSTHFENYHLLPSNPKPFQDKPGLVHYNLTISTGKVITLDLFEKKYLVRKEAKLKIFDKKEKKKAKESQIILPEGTFTGTVKNFPNSKVTLISHLGSLAGIIWLDKNDSNSEFYIQPIHRSCNHEKNCGIS